MIITASSSASRLIRTGFSFRLKDVSARQVLRNPGSYNTVVNDRDAVLERTLSSNLVSDFILALDYNGRAPTGSSVSWTSLNPSVATVSENGYASHVSDGLAVVRAVWGGQTVEKEITFTTQTGVQIDRLSAYVNGSLALEFSNEVDDRLSLEATSTMFSSMNHAAGSYVKNPSVWCPDIDFTCLGVWNSQAVQTRTCTLISPRHFACATHFKPSIGSTQRFLNSSGAPVDRSISAIIDIGWDISIGVLSSDATGVSFCKFLPSNWRNYIGAIDPVSKRALPVVAFDQQKRAGITMWAYVSDDAILCGSPVDSANNTQFLNGVMRQRFFHEKIGGDSGSPVFLLLNGQPVLLSHAFFPGGGGGPLYPYFISSINSAMTALGGGYQVVEADISSFPTYP